MSEIVLMDSGPLGMIAHPCATPEVNDWLTNLVKPTVEVRTPEIVEYEVRLELLLADKVRRRPRVADNY